MCYVLIDRSPFAETMLESVRLNCKKRALSDIFPRGEPDALNLLFRLLQFDPKNRITAENALAHPFLSQFHNEAEEPISNRKNYFIVLFFKITVNYPIKIVTFKIGNVK